MDIVAITKGEKLTTELDRREAIELIDALEASLELTPAVPINDICERAKKLDAIKSSEDRAYVGKLREEIIGAQKQVESFCKEGIQRAHQRHKAKKARMDEFLTPLETAKGIVDGIIQMDLEEQEAEREAERQRLQDEADAKAKIEQQAREKAAQEARQRELEARKAAEEALSKARSKVAKEQAQKDYLAAQERERQAKLAVADAQRTQVQAEIIEAKPLEKVEGIKLHKPKWKARVVDISKVPEQYLMPRVVNQKMIDAAASAMGKELRVPGIEVYIEAGGVSTKG